MSKMEKTLYFVLIFLIIFFLFLDLWSKANAHENSIKINSMLNPVVQVKVDGGRGSGTIFKVRGKFSYIVTNFHVVARALWLSESPDKQGYTFVRKDISINIFIHKSGKVEMQTFPAYIYAWNAEEDLATLRIEHRAKYVATMYTSKYLREFDSIVIVGAPLGSIPVPGQGIVSNLFDEYMGKWRIGVTADIVWGHSGGAAFIEHKGKYLYVGMLSNLASIPADEFTIPLTFLGSMIPSSVVLEFLHAHGL